MAMISVRQAHTDWYLSRLVPLRFSWYLIYISSNILINVVGWVQWQRFRLSDSEVMLMLKLIVNAISIFFQFCCNTFNHMVCFMHISIAFSQFSQQWLYRVKRWKWMNNLTVIKWKNRRKLKKEGEKISKLEKH